MHLKNKFTLNEHHQRLGNEKQIKKLAMQIAKCDKGSLAYLTTTNKTMMPLS